MKTLNASMLATATFAWGNGDSFWGNSNHQNLDLDDEYDYGRGTRGYRDSGRKDGRSYALENSDRWGLDFGEQNRRSDDNLNARGLTIGSRDQSSAGDYDDRSYDSDFSYSRDDQQNSEYELSPFGFVHYNDNYASFDNYANYNDASYHGNYGNSYVDSYDPSQANGYGGAFLDNYGNSYGNNYYDGYSNKLGNNFGLSKYYDSNYDSDYDSNYDSDYESNSYGEYDNFAMNDLHGNSFGDFDSFSYDNIGGNGDYGHHNAGYDGGFYLGNTGSNMMDNFINAGW